MAVKFPVVNITNYTSLFSKEVDVSKERTFKRQNHYFMSNKFVPKHYIKSERQGE